MEETKRKECSLSQKNDFVDEFASNIERSIQIEKSQRRSLMKDVSERGKQIKRETIVKGDEARLKFDLSLPYPQVYDLRKPTASSKNDLYPKQSSTIDHSSNNLRFNLLSQKRSTNHSQLYTTPAISPEQNHFGIFFHNQSKPNQNNSSYYLGRIQEEISDSNSECDLSRKVSVSLLTVQNQVRNQDNLGLEAVKKSQKLAEIQKNPILNFKSFMHSIFHPIQTICLHYACKKQIRSEDDLSKNINLSGELLGKEFDEQEGEELHFVGESSFPHTSITNEQILEMSMKNKGSSIEVQKLISRCDKERLDSISMHCLKDITALLKDRYGSYVVQKLATSNRSFFVNLAELIMTDFCKHSSNEFSSRVIQHMLKLDSSFCENVENASFKLFDELINNFSGSIMLTKIISIRSSEQTHSKVIQIIEQNREYLKNAYFNRMLSSLVQCCSITILERVVDVICSDVWQMMNDRFGNCVLQGFFKRQSIRGMSLVLAACRENIDTLFSRRFPKLMIINLIHEEELKLKDSNELLDLVLMKGSDFIWSCVQKREGLALMLLLVSRNESVSRVKKISDTLKQCILVHDELPKNECKGKRKERQLISIPDLEGSIENYIITSKVLYLGVFMRMHTVMITR